MKDLTFDLKNGFLASLVLGEQDQHLPIIESAFDVEIFPRGTSVKIQGKSQNTQLTLRLFQELFKLAQSGRTLSMQDIHQCIRSLKEDPGMDLMEIFSHSIATTKDHQIITPKTHNQKLYLEMVEKHDVSFVWGPAGTGKTYLAMAQAVSLFLAKKIKRIILTRPAVEAGEKLGFLPGDLEEKVNPYLRPLLDALDDMMPKEKVLYLIEKGIIEIAPLAFMRGRTLNNAFIILDEAQNTTAMQMKMFLTRLGNGSKAIINGDITQVDLPYNQPSGLVEALHILKKVKEIGFLELGADDVVRHPLVQKIILAYEKSKP